MMQSNIHPSAIIDPKAELDSSVQVGPYSVIGPNVKIDSGTVIASHVAINGHTTIGKNNRIFQFASLGEIPQDKKYAGEPTRLEIGNNNTIRESCTLNIGTVQDRGVTSLGDDNWIMAYVHIAHDCQVDNHTIFANSTTLAGHVHVKDYAILGGATLIHQYCIIGEHIMTGGNTVVFKDIPPYVMAAGYGAVPHGINAEGLKRRGFSSESILNIKRAYKTIYRQNLSLDEAKLALAQQAATCKELDILIEFLNQSTRGIVR